MNATATSETPALPGELSPELAELQARARRFVDEILIPLEEEVEAAGGALAPKTLEAVKGAGIEAPQRRIPSGHPRRLPLPRIQTTL